MVFRYHMVTTCGPKGYGCVATDDIPKGTTILTSHPLIAVPGELVYDLDKMSLEIEKRLLKRTPNERHRIFALAHDRRNWEDSPQPGPSGTCLTCIVLMNFIDDGEFNRGEDEEHDGGYYRTLFVEPDFARFNESCDANAKINWSLVPWGVGTKMAKMDLVAIADIQRGDEITVWKKNEEKSVDLLLESRDERRQKRLDELGGFRCLCHVCEAPEDKILQSDKRRREITELLSSMDDRFPPEPPYLESDAVAGLQVVKRVVDLLKVECPNSQYLWLEEVYELACAVHVFNGDLARAAAFLDLSLKTSIILCGASADNPAIDMYTRGRDNIKPHSLANRTDWWETKAEDRKHGLDEGFEEWVWERVGSEPTV